VSHANGGRLARAGHSNRQLITSYHARLAGKQSYAINNNGIDLR